jgi:hypothetical protein
MEEEIDELYNDFTEPVFYVDIPRLDSSGNPAEEWMMVESFETNEEAIEFAIKHFGADENGMICIISKA